MSTLSGQGSWRGGVVGNVLFLGGGGGGELRC